MKRGKENSWRWAEVKAKGRRKGTRREREGETQTKSERLSCGLNSGQLFKACACSWVGAALIKDAASEQATDAREGGTHKTRRGKATSFSGTKTETVKKKTKKQKKQLNNNYRSDTDLSAKTIIFSVSKCYAFFTFCTPEKLAVYCVGRPWI